MNVWRAMLIGVFAFVGCQPVQPIGTRPESTPAAARVETSAERTAQDDTSQAKARAAIESAAPITLAIGDLAPPLRLAGWLKGEPLTEFADGQVYVIEFWATWCVPCRVSMPHLSQLQTEYGTQVTFIGITDESEPPVEKFLAESIDGSTEQTWEQTITYRIAIDAEETPTSSAYMQAAGQVGIPTAFVIGRDGRVEWIGNPLEIDRPLASVVAGEWDRAAAIAQFQARKQVDQLMVDIRAATREGRASGDWSAVNRLLDRAQQAGLPEPMLLRLRFDTAVLSEQYEAAHEHARKLSLAVWDDPQQLNALAWDLITRVPRDEQDHKLSLLVALRASDLTQNRAGLILDTVARAYYEAGELQEAIDWQRKAVEHAPAGMDKISRTLERYEAEVRRVRETHR